MPWQITIDDKSFILDDLPGATVQSVASKHGIGWIDLVIAPAQNVNAFVDVTAEVAKLLGVQPPELVTTRQILGFIDNALERVDDDRPASWDEKGNPTAGDQTTN